MKTLYLKADDEGAISQASKILKNGGLVAIPTETVYGLAANALDGEAVGRIFIAKGRPQDNPLIVHIANLEEMKRLVERVDERAYILAEKFWPGPLTVIMKKSQLIPDEVSAGLETVAIRMPSHPVARKIIKECGVPLAAPSANASGKPSPTTAQHVIDDLEGRIDAIIDGGECAVGVESTVITLETTPPTLLRPGGVTPKELQQVLGEINISHGVYEELDENERADSPGLKYKHYAPKARVTLVKGEFEKYRRFVSAQKERTCAVCFEGEGKFFKDAIEYGKAEDSLTQAHKIFDALRQVDAQNYESAFVRFPSTKGVGLAVYNRLLRSAAFRVIDLDFDIPVYGLTGQTGAGKGVVGEILKEHNFYIIDTDKLARIAVENKEIIEMLCDEFGKDILKNGILDRKELAERAFANEERTKKLNAITHPEITRLTVLEIHKAQGEKARAAVIDAPVLFESPLTGFCDKVICVTADEKERTKRIIKRDSLTREQALARIKAQKNEEFYKENSDYIIENQTLENTREQILKFIGEELK